MKRSKISWTDYSGGNLNFVRRGKDDCEVSPGCAHCYARRIGERFGNLPDVTTVYSGKLNALRRQKFPAVDGRKPRAFVCDCGDLFHPNVSVETIGKFWTVVYCRRDVIWQVLTKRPERMLDVWGHKPGWSGPILPNLWLGVTAEDQQRADERIPILLQTPAALRFVSAEPLLERLDLSGFLSGCPVQTSSRAYVTHDMAQDADIPELEGALYSDDEWEQTYPPLDWVICGGESGPGARPMQAQWARDIRDQCQTAGVAFFFKQWSPTDEYGGHHLQGCLLDGQEWHEMPEAV